MAIDNTIPESDGVAPLLANNADFLSKQADEARKKNLFNNGLWIVWALVLVFIVGTLSFICGGYLKVDGAWHFLLLLGEILIATVLILGILARSVFKDGKPKDEDSPSKLSESAMNSAVGAIVKNAIDNMKP